MNFDFMPVASEFHVDDEAVTRAIKDFLPGMAAIGGRRISVDMINTLNPLFFFIASGGTENIVLELLKHRAPEAAGDPVYLIAHPANNSLPAALEILAKLQQENIKGRIFYLSHPESTDSFNRISAAVPGKLVKRALNNARIGCIGQPSDWLVASSPSFDIVKQTWGPAIVPISTGKIQDMLTSITANDIREMKSSLLQQARAVIEPSDTEIDDVIKVYVALKRTADEERLDALTIRCFDLVISHKTTGCFALSQLTDEGIIAGCEGDLCSTIGMYWASRFTGGSCWMANPSYLDEDKNLLGLAHCTVPRKMISSYSLRSHYESGLGLGIQGVMNETDITMLRIGGRRMEKLWIAEGRITKNGQANNLCRTQVEIQLERGGNVSDLLRNPLGNHLVLLYGRHYKALKEWHENLL